CFDRAPGQKLAARSQRSALEIPVLAHTAARRIPRGIHSHLQRASLTRGPAALTPLQLVGAIGQEPIQPLHTRYICEPHPAPLENFGGAPSSNASGDRRSSGPCPLPRMQSLGTPLQPRSDGAPGHPAYLLLMPRGTPA